LFSSRTEAEYGNLLDRANLRLVRVVPTEAPVSVVEAVPVKLRGYKQLKFQEDCFWPIPR
jgi:hypothetical protein